jgi:hypothetical protein
MIALNREVNAVAPHWIIGFGLGLFVIGCTFSRPPPMVDQDISITSYNFPLFCDME